MYTSTKNPRSQAKNFSCSLTTSLHESLEGLNSSLAILAASYGHMQTGCYSPRLEFVGVEILITLRFLCHNFGYRYARKPRMIV